MTLSLDLERRLSRLLVRGQTVASVHLLLATQALVLVPAAETASVTSSTGAATSTAASTGPSAYELDEAQYTAGAGPCLTAVRTGVAQVVPDVRRDARWTAFRATACRQGTMSVVSVPVPPATDDLRATVNLYATTPGALDQRAVDLLAPHLAHLGSVVANVHDHARALAVAANLQVAMSSRAVIEQAKGVLMAQTGCTADEAFTLLSTRSQQTNTKLRDLARDLVSATGPQRVPAVPLPRGG